MRSLTALALSLFATVSILALGVMTAGPAAQARSAIALPRLDAQKSPPATIRVMHDPRNFHWPNLQPYSIQIFDFEQYVADVVCSEMSESWPVETLKSQAVAARTYAWLKVINPVSTTYDITDWWPYQSTRPGPHPNCDASASGSLGQYLDHAGQLITAVYAADNGNPTADDYWNPAIPYLKAVEDPVAFGTRWEDSGSHGMGLSQRGAYSWTNLSGWNYQAILMHYYTGVSVEAPAGPAMDTVPPIGSIVYPWNGRYVTGSRLFIQANASDATSGLERVDFSARLPENATVSIGSDSNTSGGWTASWDVSAISDTTLSSPVVLSATLRDRSGNVGAALPAAIALDRVPPTVTASLDPTYNGDQVATLLISAGDTGSGLAGISMGNNWIWEGEEQPRWPPAPTHTTGAVISDSSALNGSAWYARAGRDEPGNTFGPFVKDLPVGKYRAYFRLKATGVLTTAVIARLDVITSTARSADTYRIGLHDVRGGDWRQSGQYQEFAVDFDHRAASDQLEFRTFFFGVADIYLDRFAIVAYPRPFAPTMSWDLGAAPLPRTVQVKAVDSAGNVSPDAVVIVGGAPVATVTPTATPSATVTRPVATASASPTPSRTLTADPTRSATPTASATLTPGAPSPTPTASLTRTATGTATTSVTRTATTATTGTATVTGTTTGTPTGTVTATPSPSATATETPGGPTRTATATGTLRPSKTPSLTPTFTATLAIRFWLPVVLSNR